jgi:hypothetical protein
MSTYRFKAMGLGMLLLGYAALIELMSYVLKRGFPACPGPPARAARYGTSPPATEGAPKCSV